MRFIVLTLSLTLVLFVPSVFAQVDPSNALLLGSGSSSSSDSGLSSGRYTTRPIDQSRTRVQKTLPAKTTRVLQSGTTQAKPVTKKSASKEPVEKQKAQVVQPKVEQAKSVVPVVDSAPKEPTAPLKKLSDKVPDKVLNVIQKPFSWSKQIITGEEDAKEDENTSEFLKLHLNDRRRNIVEIDLSPNYIYINASSPSWYHNYSVSSPGFSAAANLMLSPEVSFRTQFTTSFAADLRANTTGSEFLKVDYQRFETGIRYRQFSGLQRLSKWFVYGVDFSESVLDVPASSTLRAGNESQGVRLSAEVYLPSSKYKASSIGFEVLPGLDFKQRSSLLNLISGQSSETDAFGFWVGQRLILNRKRHLFWNLSHRIEKTQFSGTMNNIDPITGLQLKGVPIETGMTIFSFGLTWGQ